MPTWLLILLVSLALLAFWIWLGRPTRHIARSSDFERFIEGLVQQLGSTGQLVIRHNATGSTVEFVVYGSQPKKPSLWFKLRKTGVANSVTDRIEAYCGSRDLGSLQRAKTDRADFPLRVSIPNCSPARAAELARFTFHELGARPSDEYRLHYQGPLRMRRASDLDRRDKAV